MTPKSAEIFFESRGAIATSQLLGYVSRWTLPKPILRHAIEIFSLVFDVDTHEIEVPQEGFSSFSDALVR